MWEGWYTLNNYKKDTAIIKLQFQLNKDNTYDVYSFTRFKNYKAVCKVKYKMLKGHSIYLEETELVRTNESLMEINFQKMTLRIEDGFKSMKGKWVHKDGKLISSGDVLLIKKI